MPLSEKALIEKLRKQVLTDTTLSLGFADDCARIPNGDDLLVTTDSLIEDIHFRRALIRPRDLGWKTLAVNLSDLASKGAAPVGFFLNWSLPKNIAEAWIDELLAGMNEAAIFAKCPLLGGDTTGSPGPIILQITAIGKSRDPKIRSAARASDLLFTTGRLGLSALGLSIQEGEWAQRTLSTQMKHQALSRHHCPKPRLQEGAWLAMQAGVHAMMDLSDGIARDVPRMAAASKLGYEVRIEDLPQCAELRWLRQQELLTADEANDFAFWGGEDYELLVAMEPKAAPQILADYVKAFDTPLLPIGVLHETSGTEVLTKVSTQRPTSGSAFNLSTAFPTLRFAHFSED